MVNRFFHFLCHDLAKLIEQDLGLFTNYPFNIDKKRRKVLPLFVVVLTVLVIFPLPQKVRRLIIGYLL